MEFVEVGLSWLIIMINYQILLSRLWHLLISKAENFVIYRIHIGQYNIKEKNKFLLIF